MTIRISFPSRSAPPARRAVFWAVAAALLLGILPAAMGAPGAGASAAPPLDRQPLGADLARLVGDAGRDPGFLDRPDGQARLEAFLDRLRADLDKATLATAHRVQEWARQARHRLPGRPVLERVFRVAGERFAPFTDGPADPPDPVAKGARHAMAWIGRFQAAAATLPPVPPTFPLHPGFAETGAPVPPGASGPVNVAALGAAIPRLARDASDRLAALTSAAFPGHGPIRVEASPAGSTTAGSTTAGSMTTAANRPPSPADPDALDLDVRLYSWTPPFTWAGFGPVTALAARFVFRGVPARLLTDERVASAAEVFTTERLANFTVVFEASHLDRVAAAGGNGDPATIVIAWPGQSLRLPAADPATLRLMKQAVQDDLDLRLADHTTAEASTFLELVNEGNDPAVLVSGTNAKGSPYQSVSTLCPGAGLPTLSTRLFLAGGRLPLFPFGAALKQAPGMVATLVGRQFCSRLLFRPWLEDLYCTVAPGDLRLLVFTGRGFRPDDKPAGDFSASPPRRLLK